jgi:HTH-type transcriptional regulator/antitoxin HigA
MTITATQVADAWGTFQAATGGIKRPQTEAEYEELLALVDDLTNRYNCNAEPYGSLFDLIAGYMHEWELENEPELKNPEVAPHEMLAHYMEQQGVSQYQLAGDLGVSQGNLSNILAGKRNISKALAKKLAERFNVSVEMFI